MNKTVKYHKYTAFETDRVTLERLREILDYIFWEVACIQKLTPITYRVQIKNELDENFMAKQIAVIDFLCLKQGKKRARDCYYSREYPIQQSLKLGNKNVGLTTFPKIDLISEILKVYSDLTTNLCNQSEK